MENIRINSIDKPSFEKDRLKYSEVIKVTNNALAIEIMTVKFCLIKLNSLILFSFKVLINLSALCLY